MNKNPKLIVDRAATPRPAAEPKQPHRLRRSVPDVELFLRNGGFSG